MLIQLKYDYLSEYNSVENTQKVQFIIQSRSNCYKQSKINNRKMNIQLDNKSTNIYLDNNTNMQLDNITNMQLNKTSMNMQIEVQQQKKGRIFLLLGFLGAGKTTFIKHVLNNKGGQKYAIIQNQFAAGQMGIEQQLIVDQTGVPFSNFLQLPNGCICCSAKDDLLVSIQYILANTHVRNIIVQTNGLADPAQSIKQFWFDEEMKINGQLHSVISIISAQKFERNYQGNEIMQKQIIFANKILLTFADKSTQSEIQQAQQYIKQRNQQCLIQNNSYDVIKFLSDESSLKSINPNTFDMILFNKNNTSNQQKVQAQFDSMNINKKHYHCDSLYFKGICSFKNKFNIQMAIGQLLWQSGLNILRTKGVFSIAQSQTVFQLQGVNDIFQIKNTNTNKLQYKDESRILIIGQNIKPFYQKIKSTLQLIDSSN